MISPKVKIGLLVAAQVVCGMVFASLVLLGSEIGFIGLSTLADADAGLLAVWAGLSAARLGWRLNAFLVSMLCTEVATSLVARPDWWLLKLEWPFYVHNLVPVAVFGILSALRFGRKAHLRRLDTVSPSSNDNQFSIRHLLLATAVVAGALGIARGLRSVTAGGPDHWAIAIYPLCATLAQLATLWASLGNRQPTLRLSVVLPVVFIMGYSGLELAIIYEALFGLQAIIIAASLLVFRSCGWRVVWGEQSDKQMTPGDPGSATAGVSSTT